MITLKNNMSAIYRNANLSNGDFVLVKQGSTMQGTCIHPKFVAVSTILKELKASFPASILKELFEIFLLKIVVFQ